MFTFKTLALSITITALPSQLMADTTRGTIAAMPVDCGELVVTHFSGDNGFGFPDPSGAVVTLLDTRIPPILPTLWPVAGTLWNTPLFNNFGAGIHEWTAANLGTIFGLAMTDTGGNPDIYVAASPGVYGNFGLSTAGILGPAGEGGIYKIDGTTAQISTFIPTGFSGSSQMPNKGPGLGNIHVTPSGSHVYATNLDDGKIYVIDSTGTIIQIFDPFGVNQPADGNFAALGVRPYAIAIDPTGTKLFFSVWLRDGIRFSTPWPTATGPAPTNPNNSIWSVDVAGGLLIGPPVLEIVLPYLPNSIFSNPVTDISFSPSGTMMLAERTYNSDYGQIDAGHGARVLEYVPGWSPSSRNWSLGMPIVGGIAPNSVGGVSSDDDSHTWSTCDQIGAGGLYGITRLPFPGNTIPTRITASIPIQLPGALKNAMGELDYRRCNLPNVVGACCTENQSGDFLCVEVTLDECNTIYHGIYFGDGSSCQNVTCDNNPAVGACCYQDAAGWHCAEVSIVECDFLGGTWFVGQPCSAINCQAVDPIGACCHQPVGAPWQCIETTESECLLIYLGTWYAGQACINIDCEPTAACCYVDPTGIAQCIEINLFDCLSIYNGVWYSGSTCLDMNCANDPFGACCYQDAAGLWQCVETTELECINQFAGTWYASQPCSQIDCQSDPIGACCYVDATGAWICIETTALVCNFDYSGTWFANQLCSQINCQGDPIGACCYIDLAGAWNCIETTQVTCQDLIGTWFIGQVCSDIDCFAVEPLGACCFQDAAGWHCVITTQVNCQTQVGTWYLGQPCAGILCPPPDPQGACCFYDPTVGWACFQTTQIGCNANNGTWYASTPCSDIVCADPIGACCYLELSTGIMICVEVSAQECAVLPESFYNGDGSSCINVTCCLPVGACCLTDQCVLTTLPLCTSANGIYSGDGVQCLEIDCSVCVGDLDHDGDVDVADLLVLIGAWGLCP